MNYPGNPSGNWMWRMDAKAQSAELQAKIKKLNYLYSRMNEGVDSGSPRDEKQT
jgi:4-alpha-glucanotransferase